ncbi:hypothetical protein EVAR_96296_1 [Eumeta japonica]|uniref:Uncharacterized protein n=1 Tax=Eumeta variegata TaxID=151549 RepID=A0A4C1VV58_EUMVA|nr:hypothetical protein EVAR_96296_1 [Eumeta japonica]
MKDDPHSEPGTVTVVIEEMVKKILLASPHVTVRFIAEERKISRNVLDNTSGLRSTIGHCYSYNSRCWLEYPPYSPDFALSDLKECLKEQKFKDHETVVAADLMMEPEGKHRNSIIKQRILAVFGLVEIVLRCTLTMNDFQGLMMQLEGSDNGAESLEAPSSDPESQSWSKFRAIPTSLNMCCARGRPIIVEWERDARHLAGLSLVRSREPRRSLRYDRESVFQAHVALMREKCKVNDHTPLV